MAKQCGHRNQTRQGTNAYLDQIKCKDCGEILFKYVVNRVQDGHISLCTKSRENFKRLEATGQTQAVPRPSRNPEWNSSSSEVESEHPTTGVPTPTSGRPLPSRLSSEVIRKLSDAEVQQIIENERQTIRHEEQTKLAKEIIQRGLVEVPTPKPEKIKIEEDLVEKPRPAKRFGVSEPTSSSSSKVWNIPVQEDLPTPSEKPTQLGGFHVV